MPQTVIVLCGGRGTRAYPATADLPKPMLPVGGRPVLGHLLDLYARQGVTSFVLAAGHLHEQVQRWAATLPASWQVVVRDTGADTGTAGRVRRCLDLVGESFLATYGDGLGDVDLGALQGAHEAHRARGGLATVTTVPLRTQYGTLELDPDTDAVRRFLEKPVLSGHWINAGFFAFERAAFDRADGEDLERDVLPALGARGMLYAHRHEGFWKSLDTYKDQQELDGLARSEGGAPWSRGTGVAGAHR